MAHASQTIRGNIFPVFKRTCADTHAFCRHSTLDYSMFVLCTLSYLIIKSHRQKQENTHAMRRYLVFPYAFGMSMCVCVCGCCLLPASLLFPFNICASIMRMQFDCRGFIVLSNDTRLGFLLFVIWLADCLVGWLTLHIFHVHKHNTTYTEIQRERERE